MTITGRITYIGSTESYGTNGFTKRSVAVECDGQYPDSLCIDFVKDKTTLLDKFSVGQLVTIEFNTRCRESNGNRYNSITGWKINNA